MTGEVESGRPLVVFDGHCGMCARSVRFIGARDAGGVFLFTPAGSETARRVLPPLGISADAPGSLVLVEDGAAWLRSTAALRIAGRLGAPWRWLRWFLWVPVPLRDAVYAFIARHRIRREGACELLPASLRARLLP